MLQVDEPLVRPCERADAPAAGIISPPNPGEWGGRSPSYKLVHMRSRMITTHDFQGLPPTVTEERT